MSLIKRLSPFGSDAKFQSLVRMGNFFFIKKATTAILSVINNSIVYCGVHRIVLLVQKVHCVGTDEVNYQ